MTRTEGFKPDVPTTYRGIEVSDHVSWRWFSYEGTMWREGVNNALDAVIETVQAESKDIYSAVGLMYYSEWDSGLQEGRERAAEYFVDAMDTYKKDK
jgi:hypothetical protein